MEKERKRKPSAVAQSTDAATRLKNIKAIKSWAKSYVDNEFYVVPMEYADNIARYKKETFPKLYLETHEEVDKHVKGNIAILHEPSGTCALDIDNLELTKKAFFAAGIDIESICKGAWESTSGRPNSGKYFFEWPEDAGPLPKTVQMAWPKKDNPDEREVIFEFRGASYPGDVLPPSISPKTGKPYKWLVSPFESKGMPIPNALIDIWQYWDGGKEGTKARLSERDLFKSYCPWDQSAKATNVHIAQKTNRNYSPDAKEIIVKFNSEQDIVDLLKGHGYTQKGQRLVPPGDKGNHEPGVSILPGTNPKRVYSHHASDLLADGYSHDAFSAYKILQWGGDFDRAIKELSEEYGIKVRRSKSLSEKQLAKSQSDTRAVREAIAALTNMETEKAEKAADELYEKIYGEAFLDNELANELTTKLQQLGLKQEEISEKRNEAKEKSENPWEQIAEFDKTHAVLASGGGVRVVKFGKDRHGQDHYGFMKKNDAQMYYANRYISIGGEQKRLFDAWLQSSDRTTYSRLAMNPKTTSRSFEDNGEKCLNLFKGSPHKYVKGPERTDIGIFLNFIKEVLCLNDQVAYDYLLNWCAHLVQKPWEMPKTAIVMMSPEEGLGKGLFAGAVGRLMPAHYFRFDSLQQVTEKHNEHLQTGIVLFCDEATYGGSKQSEGIIRGLITDPDVTINPKFSAQYSIERFVRLIIASNHDWPAPISRTDRRFFVIKPDPRYRNKTSYYKPIGELINSKEGMQAWYSFLMDRDIEDFIPKDMPASPGQDLKQKISLKSLGLVEEYMMDCLSMESLPGNSGDQWRDIKLRNGQVTGPFSKMADIRDEIEMLAKGRQLRAPSMIDIKNKLLEIGFCEVKKNNGYRGYRFKPYEESVKIFSKYANIDPSHIIVEAEDETSLYFCLDSSLSHPATFDFTLPEATALEYSTSINNFITSEIIIRRSLAIEMTLL